MDKNNESKEIGDKEKELPTEEQEKLVDSSKELKDTAEAGYDTVNNQDAKNKLDNMTEKLTGVKKDTETANKNMHKSH